MMNTMNVNRSTMKDRVSEERSDGGLERCEAAASAPPEIGTAATRRMIGQQHEDQPQENLCQRGTCQPSPDQREQVRERCQQRDQRP